MKEQDTDEQPGPLITGILGEALLELIVRNLPISQSGLLAMLEKKQRGCDRTAVKIVIHHAIEWVSRNKQDLNQEPH